MTLLIEFLTLLGLVVAGVVVVMLVVGGFFEILNARHPERRIQKDRVNRRKWKELRQAPVSIVTLSACFAFGLFAQQQGWALIPLDLSWWSGPLMLLVSVVLYDAWFYWFHRLLHSRLFYRFHALHHKSVAPTVWSNHHESFMEALLNQAYYALIVFILPIPWQILIMQKLYDQVSGMLGHAGFEHFASPAGRAPWPLASTVFHDQHHGAFRFNYGHTFSLWDRCMGTLHPRYDITLKSFEPGGEGADRPTDASGERG
ncbi:sterol desaturase family protein [Bosea sp. (in: a-proteobacteria)]|uniref:sterol desaturase family protein n=1 Tax=Bosea sp. (in: a-proteobacteria) TaxID=1871050 RepID=UPI003F6FE71B